MSATKNIKSEKVDFTVGTTTPTKRISTDANGNLVEYVVQASASAEINYTYETVFGTVALPLTANITQDLTGAKKGIIQTIYHNNGTEPDYPANWVKLGGTYENSSLNIIYAVYYDDDRVEYWIGGTATGTDIIRATTLHLPTTSIVSSGSPAVAFVLLNNEMTYRVTGSGTKLLYVSFTVPHDYQSGGEISIGARRTATITSLTVSAWVDAVIDTAINGADVNPSTTNTWENNNSVFSTDLTAHRGKFVQIQISVVIPDSSLVYFKNMYFKYNK
jgi:hypothetical protein